MKVLMLVGDFVEDYEAMVPFQALKMLGIEVDTVCPDKVAGEFCQTAIHDFDGYQTYIERFGHKFEINKDIDKIDVDDYACLIIPGGRSPEYLSLNIQVLTIVRKFNNRNKTIASICHGAQILCAANVIENKTISAYPSCKNEILRSGGNYCHLDFTQAIVSGNIVSAPAWPAHPTWLKLLIENIGIKILKH